MPPSSAIRNIAVFCDFENIALGVRDARYDKFDMRKVLERLLLKGSIVVKKAYCDWDRYKEFKVAMHEASFEVNGFVREVLQKLPMEFAVEAQKLLEVSLEGSVG